MEGLVLIIVGLAVIWWLLDGSFERYRQRQNATLPVFLQLEDGTEKRLERTKTRRRGEYYALKRRSGSENQIELPLALRLADLNRAELLARVAMLPLKEPGKGLSLEYLSTLDFLRQINDVAGAQGDKYFVIPATQAEFDQFALPENPIPDHAAS